MKEKSDRKMAKPSSTRRWRFIVSRTMFLAIYASGILILLSLPKPLPETAPLFGIVWFFISAKILTWILILTKWKDG